MIRPKEWLEVCAMFFRDGVKEMMRNASCLVILLLRSNYLHVSKEARKSNPPCLSP